MIVGQVSNGGVFGNNALAALNALINSQGILTQGNVIWVRPFNGSDNNGGTSPSDAVKTLTRAKALATANQNDVVLLCAENNTASKTTDYQTATLDWSKDLVHLIGLNGGPFLGQRSRISNSSTATVPTPLFKVSANGCLIMNIEFYHGAGSADPSAASTCVQVTGQRNSFVNCQISGIGDSTLDDAGSNSLTISGSENLFRHCYIGLDTVIRATSVTEVILSGTPARNVFEDCQFETYTSGSTFKMITIPTGMDRFTKLLRCEIHAVQNITSAVTPTGAIGITTANGEVLVKDCYLYGFSQYVTADNAYVQMLGLNGLATGHLVGIAQGVDAA